MSRKTRQSDTKVTEVSTFCTLKTEQFLKTDYQYNNLWGQSDRMLSLQEILFFCHVHKTGELDHEVEFLMNVVH